MRVKEQTPINTFIKEIGQILQSITLNSIVDTIGRTYVVTLGINNHALLMFIIESWKA